MFLINIANLHLYSKHVIPVIKENKCIFHCFHLSIKRATLMVFVCCAVVSKWLLHRQRRALL